MCFFLGLIFVIIVLLSFKEGEKLPQKAACLPLWYFERSFFTRRKILKDLASSRSSYHYLKYWLNNHVLRACPRPNFCFESQHCELPLNSFAVPRSPHCSAFHRIFLSKSFLACHSISLHKSDCRWLGSPQVKTHSLKIKVRPTGGFQRRPLSAVARRSNH